MASNISVMFKLVIVLFMCLGAYSSPAGENLTVREGEGFEVSCLVLFGSDSVTFLKDGVPVRSSYRISLSSTKLTVYSAQMSDAGVYSCKAGDDEEVVGRITVKPDEFDPKAFGITVAIIAGMVAVVSVILGIIIYKQRCTS